MRAVEPRLATMVEPTLGVTAVPTRISASEKINVIPARAELQVDCRVPPGMDGEATMRRVHELLGDTDGVEVSFIEQVSGNRSAIESPLMDAIRDWVAESDPGAEAVPIVFPGFTDSRWFRAAFPDCVAYGFFPQRHQTLYDAAPLIHSNDERIDVRDLGFAASFFTDLPRRLLGMSSTPEGKLRLGGMALRNGLLVHGPTHWAASVRDDAGEIVTASGRKPRVRGVDGVPGVRGVVRLGEAFVVIPLVKRALPQARLPFESPGILGVAAGASLAGALLRRRVPRRDRRGRRRDALARAGGARAARRRAGRIPRRRAQGDRGVRGRRGRGRRRQGARPLRLAPRHAAAGVQPRRRAARAPRARAARARSRAPAWRSRRPPPRSRCSPGASATRRRRWRAPCAVRASSCSA